MEQINFRNVFRSLHPSCLSRLSLGKAGLFLFLVLFKVEAPAEDKGNSSGLFQRASQRETKRWTLQEWMEQKEKNRMMDLWLALNSPSPYEGLLGVGSWSLETKQTPTNSTPPRTSTALQGQVSAYASLVGLSLEASKHPDENFNDLSGLFNLRIFGNSIQSTHITLHFGQRTRTINLDTGNQVLRNSFGQISLQLYLNKYFGLDGFYRSYFPTTDSSLGEVSGKLSEAGVFIDFRALRVFGTWVQDTQTNTLNSVESNTERSGIKAGIKIFY